MKFKQTIIAWARLRVALRLFLAGLKLELANDFLRPLLGVGERPSVRKSSGAAPPKNERPVIFVSYCAGPALKGSHKYCGGEKLLNNLVLLLRRHNHEAFMVSHDGKNAGWLAEHAPFLSLDEFAERRREVGDVRCVTSWIKAEAFLALCPRFYFWDHELSASSRSHFPDLARFVAKGRIVRTAGVNRAVQAWHRAIFETPALLLRQLIDEEHWKPDPPRRIPNRVGFFDEGDHGMEYVARMRELTAAAGLDLEFVQLAGIEKEIISQMQICGTFLALNLGKSPLWGEGGPMSPQEAMACGTVPVCFDINGPSELIQHRYNGAIVADFHPEAMARELIWIYSEHGRREEMGRRSLELSAICHSMQARWPAVARFLDLPPE
ncbi:MAG: glycosyltransferase [Terrimicrobiaceae bacterium]